MADPNAGGMMKKSTKEKNAKVSAKDKDLKVKTKVKAGGSPSMEIDNP
jgi:hypothetical protein